MPRRLARGRVRRWVAGIVLLATFPLLAVSCSGKEAPVAYRTSPPPTSQAPNSLVQLSASALGISVDDALSEAPKPHQEGGSDVPVRLQDPGGAGKYQFDPSALTFEVGEVVNFRLDSETEFNTFTVETLGLNVALEKGETVEFSFAFQEAGTYTLVCIPHETLGMLGTTVVQ